MAVSSCQFCWLAVVTMAQLTAVQSAPMCSKYITWPADWHLGPTPLRLCAINSVSSHLDTRQLTTTDRQLPLPRTLPEHSQTNDSTPPTWTLPSHSAVFELSSGCVTGDYGMTFDTTTIVANNRWHRQQLPEARPTTRRDFVTLVNLVIVWGQHYQHFMMETLPRLATLRKLYPSLATDHSAKVAYLVQAGPGLVMLQQLLQVPSHQLVVARQDTLYCAQQVLFPDFVDQQKMGLLPPGAYDGVKPLLRQLPPPDYGLPESVRDDTRPLIVYLRRSQQEARGVELELETHILRVLQRRVDSQKYRLHFWHPHAKHGWQQDRRIFHHAAVVIGPHGGAFSNLPFCPSTTVVVEILPWSGLKPAVASDVVKRDVRPCYWSMATALGLDYWQFEPQRFGFNQANMTFDGELLVGLLAKLGVLTTDV
eukprot:m.263825 g.263825  ORF g.263825 m.263825 type:complete len:423 (+) comp17614_c0_seq1:6437-7705(+)